MEPRRGKIYLITFLCLSHLGLWAQNIHINKYEGKPQSITRIRVASVSIIPDKWEKNSNWLRIEKMVRRAALEGGAKVVVTPEGALDGYVINEVNRDLKMKTDKSLLDQFFDLGELIDNNGDVKVLGNGGDIAYYDVQTSREKNKNPFRNRRPGTYGKLIEMKMQLNDILKN
jgi:ribosomal protein L3